MYFKPIRPGDSAHNEQSWPGILVLQLSRTLKKQPDIIKLSLHTGRDK